MSQSSVPRALSWTSLFALTLVAGLLESLILFPTTLVPGTRLAAALSWDASNPGYPVPETPAVETPAADAPAAPAPSPAAQAPAQPAPAEPRGEPRVITGRVIDAATGGALRGVSIWAGPAEIVTDAEGRFTTAPVVPGSTIWVKTPGYERRKLTAGPSEITVKLPPHPVRAA